MDKPKDYIKVNRWLKSKLNKHQIDTIGSFTSGQGIVMGIGIILSFKTNEKQDTHMKQFLLDIVQQTI